MHYIYIYIYGLENKTSEAVHANVRYPEESSRPIWNSTGGPHSTALGVYKVRLLIYKCLHQMALCYHRLLRHWQQTIKYIQYI